MVHLHRHSEYSRLDGIGTNQQYAERAAEMDQFALALTDHGTLSGALHHIKACRDCGIIPISGVEAYFRPDRSIRDKENRRAFHLCVFARNLKGWKSLMRMTSIAYQDNREGGGFYQYPCVDFDLLDQHKEGLAITSGCISSYLSHLILTATDREVDRYVKWMLDHFGDHFWFEIQPHDFEEQRLVNIAVVNLAAKFGRPVVAATDAHAPWKEWMTTQQVAKLMSTSSNFRDQKAAAEKAAKEGTDEGFAKLLPTAYLMEENEVRDLFAEAHPDIPEHVVDDSIKATHDFAHSTVPFVLDRKDKLPKVSESVEHSEKILRGWCEEGLRRIGKESDQDYLDRYEYEFGVLKKKGVLDYFILTGDVVRWARAKNIRTNVRGSAAGCLVSYLIGITHIDPIAWGLLFERFLNPDRKGLPDIDIDFDRERRDEVKQYLRNKYGEDHVADIIAHQTFAPKKVLIDVARTFNVPSKVVDELSKSIDIRPDDDETELEQIRTVNETLDDFADEYPDVWEHALRLEGSVANASKHAAGVVVTGKPITNYMPLERGKKGDLVTSWSDRADFPAVSDHGLVKLDMLGIKGLTKQAVALDMIKRRHGKKLDLDNLPLLSDPNNVDTKVMEIFSKGLTLGIWQFGSRGITGLLRQVKPDSGFDLAAANALYRPGPMGTGITWQYAELKEDHSSVEYWDDSVEPVLAETYGLIAYQEQVMEICKQLGGFTGGQADAMRKAMGKLYRLAGNEAQRFMGQFKEQWDKGTSDIGLSPETAEDIWNKILSFGGYGFNKSHAASYAVQAYQDAYLKAHYPAEFFCALLLFPPSTSNKKRRGGPDLKYQFMQTVARECEALAVGLAPPHLNLSKQNFWLSDDPEDNEIRFGLESIKDVGKVAAKSIINRRMFRPYESWEDFLDRCAKKGDVKANSKVQTALIESGAADCFGMRDEASGQQQGAWEKQRLHISLSMSGPIQEYQAMIAEEIHSMQEVDELDEGREVVVGGDVIDVKEVEVKKGHTKGQLMAHVTIAFGMNQYRCTFFPKAYSLYRGLIANGSMMVSGKKNVWRGTVSIVVEQAIDIETWTDNIIKELQEESVGG